MRTQALADALRQGARERYMKPEAWPEWEAAARLERLAAENLRLKRERKK